MIRTPIPIHTALDCQAHPLVGSPAYSLLTPHFCLVIQDDREQVPESDIWPIGRSEMNLNVFRSL